MSLVGPLPPGGCHLDDVVLKLSLTGELFFVLFKILRTDDASDFDELDFKFFNDDGTVTGSGGPDVSVNPSLGLDQFNEYEFTAGVTDDGIGTPLDEFIAFQIKIVMRATNSARPPRIKDLRILALAT